MDLFSLYILCGGSHAMFGLTWLGLAVLHEVVAFSLDCFTENWDCPRDLWLDCSSPILYRCGHQRLVHLTHTHVFSFSVSLSVMRMMMVMMMMMMTIYRVRIYPCCNSMLITLERPQSLSWLFLSLMYLVCLCYHNPPSSDIDFRIFIVHTDVNACSCTRGYANTERESALKVDSGKKIPWHIGESNLHQRRDGSML